MRRMESASEAGATASARLLAEIWISAQGGAISLAERVGRDPCLPNWILLFQQCPPIEGIGQAGSVRASAHVQDACGCSSLS